MTVQQETGSIYLVDVLQEMNMISGEIIRG